MDRPAIFIMSLDCEGKWGMADQLRPYHDALTDDALLRAYGKILQLLDRYDIAATFAFVMAFTLTKDKRGKFDDILKPRPASKDAWLEPYWSALGRGEEGWHQPDAFDLVRRSARHEIACHSFCHRPLGPGTSHAEAIAELGAAQEVALLKGVQLSTFVFPRNEVGNLPALRQSGFIGYRERLARPAGAVGRLISLGAEINTQPGRQQSHAVSDGLVPIPAGYFFNWRFGPRALIPPAVTVARWRHLLRGRHSHGNVVHLWLHPHNLITAPSTADVLDRVLADVAEARQVGDIRVETQDSYCRQILAAVLAAESPAPAAQPLPA